jgi:hypothetical protein
MKRKFIATVLGGFSISALLIFSNYAHATADLSSRRAPSNLTDNQKENFNNIMKKLNIAWGDIKKDLKNDNIDTSEYMQIDFGSLELFSNGEGHITDKEKAKAILREVVFPSLEEAPDESLEPLILVSKDGNKVLFCYKTKEGTNVIKNFIFKDEKWTSVSKETKGELPLDIKIEASS